MKKTLALIVCLAAASVFGARQVVVPTLPESPFADTETSTNVAFCPCLCREGWDMVRFTRRGVSAASPVRGILRHFTFSVRDAVV